MAPTDDGAGAPPSAAKTKLPEGCVPLVGWSTPAALLPKRLQAHPQLEVDARGNHYALFKTEAPAVEPRGRKQSILQLRVFERERGCWLPEIEVARGMVGGESFVPTSDGGLIFWGVDQETGGAQLFSRRFRVEGRKLEEELKAPRVATRTRDWRPQRLDGFAFLPSDHTNGGVGSLYDPVSGSWSQSIQALVYGLPEDHPTLLLEQDLLAVFELKQLSNETGDQQPLKFELRADFARPSGGRAPTPQAFSFMKPVSENTGQLNALPIPGYGAYVWTNHKAIVYERSTGKLKEVPAPRDCRLDTVAQGPLLLGTRWLKKGLALCALVPGQEATVVRELPQAVGQLVLGASETDGTVVLSYVTKERQPIDREEQHVQVFDAKAPERVLEERTMPGVSHQIRVQGKSAAFYHRTLTTGYRVQHWFGK